MASVNLRSYEERVLQSEKFNKKSLSYIRKCLRLHHTISSLALYSFISPCPLPCLSFLVMKAAKISGYLLLRDFSDPVAVKQLPKPENWEMVS